MKGETFKMHFYGLFGRTLGHSISPQIHKKIYEVTGIEAAYKNFEIENTQLEEGLQAMKLLGIRGANVTIPYKEDFLPLMDAVSPLVEKLQSVNTIKNEKGTFIGYNTDYEGIAMTFDLMKWEVKDKKAYILGSGGASHAIAHYLKDQGAASVTIVSRMPSGLQSEWEFIDYTELQNRAGDFIINCTPVGMYPHIDATPVDVDILSHFSYLFDMTYNPAETKFLKIGNQLGKETVNGLIMLVGQAMRSVEIWEDRKLSPKDQLEILTYFQENWQGAL